MALWVLLSFAGLAFWVGAGASRPAPAAAGAVVDAPAVAGVDAAPRLAAAQLRAEEPLEYAADGVPIKSSEGPSSTQLGPMHPHPITDAHERIFRENNLVGALNLAVDLEDAPRIRALVAEYRQAYPEDAHRLQDGYAMIGDCLEKLDDATRARARHFWETEIRSQTRRYVRRYCLDR